MAQTQPKHRLNVANLITVSRFPVLVLVVVMLYHGSALIRLLAAPAILVLILMDTLDGVVARRRHEETLVGSALDIAADRAVEVVLWIVYASLGLISLAIPVTFVIRGALTDSIRNVALQHGKSAHSMMRTGIGHWLVASSPMRTGYAVVKIVAFITLAIALSMASPGGSSPLEPLVRTVANVATWLSLVLCILRGLPVIMEMPKLFSSSDLVAAPEHKRQTPARPGE
ncbi:MAG: CDP-alcohol phosphatidyltransferase family protein [Chloroflexi bacterium]|nr:CDP-alcohol phosphatidyltransferase family protein [Chloroflexota bacterium]